MRATRRSFLSFLGLAPAVVAASKLSQPGLAPESYAYLGEPSKAVPLPEPSPEPLRYMSEAELQAMRERMPVTSVSTTAPKPLYEFRTNRADEYNHIGDGLFQKAQP